MHLRQAAACVAVAAALAAGCARRDTDDVLARAAGTTTTAGDQRTAADRQADVATAKTVALTQADLPAGWTAEPPAPEDSSGPSDAELNQQFATCLHVDPKAFASDDPEFDSPTFTNVAGDEVEIDATMTADADAGARRLAIYKSAAAPGCFAQVIKSIAAGALPAGTTVGDVTAVAVPVQPIGDGAAQYRITVPVTSDGQSATVTFDIVLVLAGRTGITGSFTTYGGQPFDAALARQLTQKVVDRAPAA